MTIRVFISHSSADKPLAKTIYRSLRDQAVALWFDSIELRPGDSLLKRIAEGITTSDYLLVLVTETSIRSEWVQKEVSIALSKESNGDGPTIIPVLLDGCDAPTMLTDKLHVNIDAKGNGSKEIVPAIFRDSYILDITLRSDTLQCDPTVLRDELYEFIRQDYADLKVRIEHHDFNHRVISIAEQSAELDVELEYRGDDALEAEMTDSLTWNYMIKRDSEAFNIELPIYWVNLSELLARFIGHFFDCYGRNLDAVKRCTEACLYALDFAHYVMYSKIRGAIFSIHAQKFGHPDIAEYVGRFESNEGSEYEEMARKILNISDDLVHVSLKGILDNKILDQKICMSAFDVRDIESQEMCSPEIMISKGVWFSWCLPQIIGNSLKWSTFHEGKPLHELPYNIGFLRRDYRRTDLIPISDCHKYLQF